MISDWGEVIRRLSTRLTPRQWTGYGFTPDRLRALVDPDGEVPKRQEIEQLRALGVDHGILRRCGRLPADVELVPAARDDHQGERSGPFGERNARVVNDGPGNVSTAEARPISPAPPEDKATALATPRASNGSGVDHFPLPAANKATGLDLPRRQALLAIARKLIDAEEAVDRYRAGLRSLRNAEERRDELAMEFDQEVARARRDVGIPDFEESGG